MNISSIPAHATPPNGADAEKSPYSNPPYSNQETRKAPERNLWAGVDAVHKGAVRGVTFDDDFRERLAEVLVNTLKATLGPSAYKAGERYERVRIVIDAKSIAEADRGVYFLGLTDSNEVVLERDAGSWDGQFYTPGRALVTDPDPKIVEEMARALKKIDKEALEEFKHWGQPP
jgi:hypothetical protein